MKDLEIGSPRVSVDIFGGGLRFPVRLTALKPLDFDHGLKVKAYDVGEAIVDDCHVYAKASLSPGERGVVEFNLSGSEASKVASFKLFYERRASTGPYTAPE